MAQVVTVTFGIIVFTATNNPEHKRRSNVPGSGTCALFTATEKVALPSASDALPSIPPKMENELKS